MFVVELAFDGSPGRLAERPAHREKLAALHAEGRLVMAGPWDDDTGALLVFRVGQAELDAIMAADPYYHAPGVTVAAIRHWEPVIGTD
jgi:uncharacterized protein